MVAGLTYELSSCYCYSEKTGDFVFWDVVFGTVNFDFKFDRFVFYEAGSSKLDARSSIIVAESSGSWLGWTLGTRI